MRPRQQLPPVYRRAGSVYLSRREVVMEHNTLISDECVGVIVPPHTAIDIDTVQDLELARVCYNSFDKSSSSDPFRSLGRALPNHNGSVDLLMKMADAAADAGATHVKVQHIFSDKLYIALNSNIKNKWFFYRPWKEEFERLKSLELTTKDYQRFVDHVVNQLA